MRLSAHVCSAALALWLIPSTGHAEDEKRSPWQQRPRTNAPFLERDCAAEMTIRAETAGVDLSELGTAIETAFAALSPHAGVMVRVDGTVRPLLLIPMSLPIGPAGPTRTQLGWDECFRREEAFRPFRLSLEPGLVLRKYSTGFVRGSFRSIWHPADSFFGVGAGFGAMVDWQGGRALGFGPELLLQFGACCGPPFWQLSVRRDQFPSDRDREAIVFVFGPTVW